MGEVKQPRGQRGRAAIVDAALRILDRYGLADLTMRRLATELDVRASALYWHFESKQALLAAVTDRIVDAMALPEEDADWRAAAAAVAHALRDALLAHRDGAEVVLSTYALGLGDGAARRRLTDALGRRHPEGVAAQAGDALLQFVLGHASLVQQRLQAAELGVATPAAGDAAAATFELGIDLLLDGLAERAPAAG